MLHLLPPAYIQELRREYNMRAGVLALWLLAIAFFLGAVSLVPSFLMLSTEKEVLEARAEVVQLSLDSEEAGTLLAFEAGLQEKLSYITKTNVRYLDVMESVLSLSNNGVSIRNIKISEGEGGVEITIGGVAAARGDLAAFQKKLDEAEHIKSVDVPLSVFTKERNLDFNMVVNVKNQ